MRNKVRTGDSKGDERKPEPQVPVPMPAPLVRRVTTEAQREASRRNGKKSRGPRTAEGKAVSSANAVKHGVLSKRPVLPRRVEGMLAREGVIGHFLAQETSDEFQALLEHLADSLQPRDSFNRLLVEKMALTVWRLRRLQRYERAEVERELRCYEVGLREALPSEGAGRERKPPPIVESRAALRLMPDKETLDKITRYEAMLEREFNRCYGLLERRRELRERDDVPPVFLSLRL
ncbi:MAG: hypothetical protein JSV08_07940 [Acidobacteriota bacterium]|nr:MAG: hypothetical protein JSV08_07940 [Acidobacteriota bacterium]